MGRGSQSLLTTWIPWSDVPIDLGGLVVLEGSHRLPGFSILRETLGKTNADQTEFAGHTLTDPFELSALDALENPTALKMIIVAATMMLPIRCLFISLSESISDYFM